MHVSACLHLMQFMRSHQSRSCVHHVCPAHWGWPAASSPSLRFSGGKKSRAVQTGGQASARPTPADTHLQLLEVVADELPQCFRKGMNVLSLQVVCTITGFEEAARRGGGWEHAAAAAAAAAAPNSQCARSEGRRGDNTDPRSHWGAAISHRLPCLLVETSPGVAFLSSAADLFIDRDQIDFVTSASGLISKLSHDVSGEIPKGQGDRGRIRSSS